MKILGLLFIIVGLFLCLTLFFAWFGLASIGVGALLWIAGKDRPLWPTATTPGLGRRLLLGGFVAVALLGLVWYGELMKPAAPIAPAAARQLTPAPQPSSAQHNAKHHPAH